MSDLLLAVIGQGIINIILVAGIVATRNRRDNIEQKPKEGKHRSSGAGGSCNGCPPPM